MNEKISTLKNKIFSEKKIKIIVFIGIIGMLLIMVSSFIPQKEKVEENPVQFDYYENYKSETEKSLEELLKSIYGVGEVKVMLTLQSTEHYIYAEENKSVESSDVSSSNEQNENKLVKIENGGQESALVKHINLPEISGVVVVCEGGDNARTCECIYRSVSTALGIPTSKIYVTKIKL